MAVVNSYGVQKVFSFTSPGYASFTGGYAQSTPTELKYEFHKLKYDAV